MSELDNALDVLYALVLEDGRRWGEAATDFQIEDAKQVLALNSPTPYHLQTRARGSSKTSDLGAQVVTVTRTQLGVGQRAYGVASDKDQARLLLDAAAGFIMRTPGLAQEFDIGVFKIANTRTGASFEVLSADAPGAWGLRGHFYVLDEIAQWPSTPGARQLFEAITSAAAKLSDARMVLLTTAGSPSHWSYKLRAHALADPLWTVHEVQGPSPWMDQARLQEQKRRLPESSYRRLFQNEWVEAEDMLTTIDDLRAAIQLDGPQEPVRGQRYVVGLDVGLKNDRSVATVCHVEEGGVSHDEKRRVVLDRIAVWQGTRKDPVQLSDVEAWLLHASKDYNNAALIFDPWQAAGTMQRLRTQGVRVVEFSFTAASVGKLAVALHNALRNRSLALPDDPDLIDELSNVRIRESTPNVYRLDHVPGQHDDRAISLALCVSHLLDKPVQDFGSVTFDILWQVSPNRPESAGAAWFPG
ncbi:MAG: hypothetical protein M3Q18_10370 [Actinomycetota bacterium]|nr:hypothetical protein [Actinomycetota bacterium]